MVQSRIFPKNRSLISHLGLFPVDELTIRGSQYGLTRQASEVIQAFHKYVSIYEQQTKPPHTRLENYIHASSDGSGIFTYCTELFNGVIVKPDGQWRVYRNNGSFDNVLPINLMRDMNVIKYTAESLIN